MVLAAALASMVMQCFTFAPIFVSADPTVAITASEDAHVYQYQFNTNYGSATSLEVKQYPDRDRYGYIKFDLSALTGADQAVLRVYGSIISGGSPTQLTVHPVEDDSWSESTITWATKPASPTTVLGSATVVTGPAYYDIDVTAFVQSELTGDQIVTLRLENDNQALIQLNSSENASNPPQLLVTESTPSPGTITASEDAHVYQYQNTINYGSLDTLEIKEYPDRDRYGYLKFDLSGLTEVVDAKLRLYGSIISGGSPTQLTVHPVDNDSWSESTITWANKPVSPTTVLGSATVVTGPAFYEVDVTSFIQSQFAGDKVATLRLENDTQALIKFNSSENATNPPQLIVNGGGGGGDTEPPTPPTNLTATVLSSTAIELNWSASADNVGVAGYTIFADGVEVFTTTSTQYVFSGSPSTTYTFHIVAFDASGNDSTASAAVSATTPADGGGNVKYVDPTGAGGAYTTIGAAASASQPGDLILVRDGIYEETVGITKSGTASNKIVFRAEGDNALVKGIFDVNASYVRLEGFDMDGALPGGDVMTATAVLVKKPNVEVVGLDIRNYRGRGIYFDRLHGRNGNSGYAADNYIYNCFFGIELGDNSVAERNEIERINAHGSTEPLGDAFRVFGSNVIIRDNFLHGTIASEIEPVHSDVIQSWDDVDIPVQNVLVENNRFHGFYRQGILLENDANAPSGIFYISDWTVRNNIFSNYSSWGMLAGKTNGGIPNMIVENNVFDAGAANGFNGVVFYGIGGTGKIRNNIIMNSTTSSYDVRDGATAEMDYNLVFQAPVPPNVGPNDIIGLDPRFVNPAQLDYHLRSDSPAINTGGPVGFTFDLEGNPRPTGSAVDIGAYEFQGTPSGSAPLVTINSPIVGSVHPIGGDVVVDVNARDSDGSVSRVEYTLNGQSIGQSTAAPFGMTIPNLAEGIYTLSAVVFDDDGLSSNSGEVLFVVSDDPHMTANTTWQNQAIAPKNGTFQVAFDIIPLSDAVNGIAGFGSGTVDAYSEAAAVVRFGPGGVIDARNGSAYNALTSIPYEKGKRYRVVMDINVVSHTYSVYVTPEGGSQQTVGINYLFRTEQQAVTQLDHFVVYAATGSFLQLGAVQ